jgi:hypothetical protein
VPVERLSEDQADNGDGLYEEVAPGPVDLVLGQPRPLPCDEIHVLTERDGMQEDRHVELLDGRQERIATGIGERHAVTGMHLASICKALGMHVIGVSRSHRAVEGVDRIARRGQLAEVAALVDYLVLVAPASPETDGLVDEAVLAAMQPTAFLINLGRGSLVDEAALVAALREGVIAGAGLDAFATEPLPDDSPLWQMDNVVVTPHLAGAHDRYHEQALALVLANMRAFAAGAIGEMRNVVALPVVG